MKFLMEDYGQSQELNTFIYQYRTMYHTYYVVDFVESRDSRSHELRYFAFEDAARSYYNKLLDDMKAYGWDGAHVELIKVNLVPEEDTLDEFDYIEDDEESEETELEEQPE